MIIEKLVEVHEPFLRENAYILTPEGRLIVVRDVYDISEDCEQVSHDVEAVRSDIPFTAERVLDALYQGLI